MLKTRKEIADYFNVTPKTIDVWRKENGMPCIILPSGSVRFKLVDCIKWSEQRGE